MKGSKQGTFKAGRKRRGNLVQTPTHSLKPVEPANRKRPIAYG